jgi:hypothetical protein
MHLPIHTSWFVFPAPTLHHFQLPVCIRKSEQCESAISVHMRVSLESNVNTYYYREHFTTATSIEKFTEVLKITKYQKVKILKKDVISLTPSLLSIIYTNPAPASTCKTSKTHD